jgi:DNA polymerase
MAESMVTTLELLATEASTCTSCELSRTRHRVVFSSGPPDATLMLVGEAPGAEEDVAGLPFVGRSGALLGSLLDELGLARDALYVTNVVKCRPPANRNPARSEVVACRRYLEGQLSEVAPRVVVSLGNIATRALLETTAPISVLRGSAHLSPSGRCVVPTFHPAAGLRGGPAVVAKIREDLARAAGLLGGGV